MRAKLKRSILRTVCELVPFGTLRQNAKFYSEISNSLTFSSFAPGLAPMAKINGRRKSTFPHFLLIITEFLRYNLIDEMAAHLRFAAGIAMIFLTRITSPFPSADRFRKTL